MSDPGLLTIDPGVGGLERWLTLHNLDHIRLADAANRNPTAKIEYRILDPLGADLNQWLLDHQRSHLDLGAFTGVLTSDLTSVDFSNPRERDSWIQLNQVEHAAFAVVLGI